MFKTMNMKNFNFSHSLVFPLLVSLAVMMVSCNLDFRPSDEIDGPQLLNNIEGATSVMDGCYALLKDEVEYIGYQSGNTYVRHYFQMAEFPADNTCLSSRTTDPLYEATAYMMTDNLKNVGTLWMLAYKVIFMCNAVIENLPTGAAANNQLVGEAYFLRALMHFHLVTLYARPYVMGRDNAGVPLRLTSENTAITRAPVGQVYDQVVEDLKQAANLMGESRGNHGYPSHDAALGLLSRVYLYMGMNDEVVKTVNSMLGGEGSGAAKLDNDFANYFINAKTSDETLFCIAHKITDNKAQSSIGSMYNGDGGGWGEVYPSNPLLYLYERYPSDVRYTAFIHPQQPKVKQEGVFVYFPDPDSPDDMSGRQVLVKLLTADGDDYTFKDDDGNTCRVHQVMVQGEYKEWHVTYKGEDCLARVHEQLATRTTDYNPQYFVTKLGYQDAQPHLSSPVMLRWAEVLLNRAEAYAKLNEDEKALADVNDIRTRAGIPQEGLFSTAQMHGYDNVLDIVLDERRLELAFEGHRRMDVYRNERNMDRRFPGAQPWEVVPYTANKIQYPIPNAEWTVSGIAQNPGY